MTATVMILVFLVLMTLGTPIGFSMGLAAVVAIAAFESAPLILLPQLFYTSIDNFSLLAIPLFVFAGALMGLSGITEQLVALARSLVGHLRGGLAQANVLTNTFMSAISGSAAADVAAVGSIMIPAMTRAGYDKPFAVAVTSSAAMLAPIIPPSIIAVIYSSVTGVSVGKLFIAGVIPGIICAMAIMLLTWYYALRAGTPRDTKATFAQRGRAIVVAGPALLMPVLVLGGILGGIFTATEAGALACVYALIYCLFRMRTGASAFYEAVMESAITTGTALVVLAGAALFSWVLVRTGSSAAMMNMIMGVSNNPHVVMALVLGMLFFVGIVMEPIPALVLTGPLLVTAANAMNFDPLSFGIAVIMMLIVGSVTPPVGVLAMIACRIAKIPYSSTFRVIIPFTLVWLAVIALIAYVPSIANFLPSLLTE
ncbi:TRAP transporter large permease [Thermomonas sp.]|uniref:TRAP transporter large permease n=1 Tax=Thermomonas sp. TaxID=1971895 RepID=UPI0024883792|nr:TRAP transporter large permease [Thermomonas sp.]MDI1251583.1 TRAP transporter large permease [Thermomonas sp.]